MPIGRSFARAIDSGDGFETFESIRLPARSKSLFAIPERRAENKLPPLGPAESSDKTDWTTKLYDQTQDELTLDEIEGIANATGLPNRGHNRA